MDYLNDDRKVWKYIIFSFLTCGIYGIYYMYTMVNDWNRACSRVEGSPENNSPNYIIVCLLTFVTCGIYFYWWMYTQGNRMQRAGNQYGIRIDENGTAYILWFLLASWICGVGAFMTVYLMTHNCNKLCTAYNNYDRGNGNFQEVKQEKQLAYLEDYKSAETPSFIKRNPGLSWVAGEFKGNIMEMADGETFYIGRDPSKCQIIMSDPTISRVHCRIRYSQANSTYYVTDYSSHGVIVNETKKLIKEIEEACEPGYKVSLAEGKEAFVLL